MTIGSLTSARTARVAGVTVNSLSCVRSSRAVGSVSAAIMLIARNSTIASTMPPTAREFRLIVSCPFDMSLGCLFDVDDLAIDKQEQRDQRQEEDHAACVEDAFRDRVEMG